METVSVVFAAFGAVGGLVGIVGVLQFFNTRKQVQSKGQADIAAVWNGLTEGAMKAAENRIRNLEAKERGLINLVQLMIEDEDDLARKELYQDKLDDLRRIG